MFTGIIEQTGTVTDIISIGTNKTFWLSSPISNDLKIDQSVSHNGVCLTVEELKDGQHRLTAIEETLVKTDLDSWRTGTVVNLERCLQMNGRLDGHIVQGHVDQVGTCTSVKDASGSWYFTFMYDAGPNNITIEKGSITVNGVSLTVVNSKANEFSVAIIPYTYEHTNFKNIKPGTVVNLEFDVVGKYVARLHALRS